MAAHQTNRLLPDSSLCGTFELAGPILAWQRGGPLTDHTGLSARSVTVGTETSQCCQPAPNVCGPLRELLLPVTPGHP
jgi:hypothetical protein